MTDKERLHIEFDKDIRHLLDTEHEIACCSTRLRRMVEEHDGEWAAHRLLESELKPGNIKYCRDRNRRDLIVESYVADPKYRELFTQEERDIAKFRLEHED
jgi:hypothetical protein